MLNTTEGFFSFSVSHRYQFGLLPPHSVGRWKTGHLSQYQPWWSDHCGLSGPHKLPGALQDLCSCSISEFPMAFGVLSTWRGSCQHFLMSWDGALAGLAADSLQKWISFCVGSPPLPESLRSRILTPMCWKAEIFHCGVFNFSNNCCHSISQ